MATPEWLPEIYAAAERFKQQLLSRERAAAMEMVRAYAAAWQRIKAGLDDLTERMDEAVARGETVSPWWLFQHERLQSLERQVEAEITRIARDAEIVIRAEQMRAVSLAE